MPDPTPGLHHVTAITGDPQATVDAYAGALGLRLVKTTVNFDDPSTYHLYFGDETGTPGTVFTCFPFRSSPRGRVGTGQAAATAFAVPPDALEYWPERLDASGFAVDAPAERFGETVLACRDGDGQPLELVGTDAPVEPWADGPVPVERAIRGFHGVTLRSPAPEATGGVLERLGYEAAATADEPGGGERTRYRAAGDRAAVVDVVSPADVIGGRQGPGTVHHVAFRCADEAAQDAWRERLVEAGLAVTPPRDRRYFRSVYCREPGGVLFELATDGPGFAVDEPVDALGSSLRLPPWLEEDRAFLEARLPALEPAGAGAD